MTESERLSEAEATVALDRDDESGTKLVVPENAQLTQEDFNLAAKEYEDTIGEPWELEYGSYLFSLLSIAQAEKAYPLGFDAGWKARDAKVAELQEQVEGLADARMSESKLFTEVIKERNTALEHVRTLREAGDALATALGPEERTHAVDIWDKTRQTNQT